MAGISSVTGISSMTGISNVTGIFSVTGISGMTRISSVTGISSSHLSPVYLYVYNMICILICQVVAISRYYFIKLLLFSQFYYLFYIF